MVVQLARVMSNRDESETDSPLQCRLPAAHSGVRRKPTNNVYNQKSLRMRFSVLASLAIAASAAQWYGEKLLLSCARAMMMFRRGHAADAPPRPLPLALPPPAPCAAPPAGVAPDDTIPGLINIFQMTATGCAVVARAAAVRRSHRGKNFVITIPPRPRAPFAAALSPTARRRCAPPTTSTSSRARSTARGRMRATATSRVRSVVAAASRRRAAFSPPAPVLSDREDGRGRKESRVSVAARAVGTASSSPPPPHPPPSRFLPQRA